MIEPAISAKELDVEPRACPTARPRNLPRSSSSVLSAIRQYVRPTPPATPTSTSTAESPACELGDMPVRSGSGDLSLTEGASLVVSFTIAMPRRRDKAVVAASETLDRDR